MSWRIDRHSFKTEHFALAKSVLDLTPLTQRGIESVNDRQLFEEGFQSLLWQALLW